MFPEGLDMNALLQQAQAMQEQLQQAQDELANSTFIGSSGGGLVKVTITGGGELIGLKISPDAVDMDDLDSLSDLIIAAFRDASGQAAQQAQTMMPDLGAMGDMGDLGF
ncbi:MAG: YbaB/EbfC family nucleoid-associated protein [Brooklawnia sp.]|nr:YbaB/EbfC family nucleoid-associated protein [Brooklawnia sp.]